jgi:beta-carotene hydroxylase
MSFLWALAEGVVFPYRIWWWAVRHAERGKGWLSGEAAGCLILAVLAVLLLPVTPVFAAYVGLIVAGAWLNPLLTAYLPHDPQGRNELTQTRLFRGKVASVLAWDHLYHLEHHLYPAVPHHHWPTLARRLDPHLEAAGVRPIKFWFSALGRLTSSESVSSPRAMQSVHTTGTAGCGEPLEGYSGFSSFP